jgi:integrase
MNLSAGEHYMQVSKWLGHSTFVLTLTTYADYIREDELAAPKVERGTARHANSIIAIERRAL